MKKLGERFRRHKEKDSLMDRMQLGGERSKPGFPDFWPHMGRQRWRYHLCPEVLAGRVMRLWGLRPNSTEGGGRWGCPGMLRRRSAPCPSSQERLRLVWRLGRGKPWI